MICRYAAHRTVLWASPRDLWAHDQYFVANLLPRYRHCAARDSKMPDDAHLSLNAFVINVALPALVLGQIHGLRPTTVSVWPVLMPWFMFLLSTVSFIGLAHALKLSRPTTGALIMTAGLANTSFIGLPMIEAFYGAQHLATGILIDQFGTYLVPGTAGITVVCLFSGGVVRSANRPPRPVLSAADCIAAVPCSRAGGVFTVVDNALASLKRHGGALTLVSIRLS